MSVINTQPLIGASGQGGSYNIDRSLRFRSSASASLTRTPASASNLTTWTWSAWIKRGTLGAYCELFSAGPASNNSHHIYVYADDRIGFEFYNVTYDYYIASNAVLRDPAAWYHVVAVWDTTQSTAANRMKLYVNNVLINTNASTSYPTQNLNGFVNTTAAHAIAKAHVTSASYFDGYMTEQNFIDGQALTPSSFGETDSVTGVWKPKRYTGTYGTNGFYLKFTDVATTSGSNAGLGKDFSGNGNYWTTNNISVTSGSTYDSMTDVPTLTSATTANYCVMNPLITLSGTISDGNLKNVFPGTATNNCSSTMFSNSGKFYVEVTPSALSGNAGEVLLGDDNNGIAVGYRSTGTKDVDSYSTNSAYGATWTVGDVIGMAADITNKSVTFYKNGVSQGAITYTGSAAKASLGVVVTTRNSVNMTFTVNYGQQPWAYSPPSGYSAWNTYNLPDSTIVAGNANFEVTTYTANGGVQTVTNASGLKPDLWWGKGRSGVSGNYLIDSVRGVSNGLQSQLTNAESSIPNYVTSFNSNGFSLGTDNYPNGTTLVAWQWKAGQGTTSSNTNGSITSTVSVNPTAGFSIVTYTGNGTNNATVGHGLGVTPAMIIAKNRTTGSTFWPVYHKSFSSNYVCWLNSTLATQSIASTANGGIGSVSSSIFTCINGTSGGGEVNANTNNYIAYCWAEVAGFSKFGSYTGNGSSDGPFIYTGFRPKYVLLKNTSGAGSWVVIDSSRSTYNVANDLLLPNGSNAELVDDTGNNGDFLSNGFKLRATDGTTNLNGSTYIYAAFAENPFKNSLAR